MLWWIHCSIHDLVRTVAMVDLIFSFGFKGDFYFYSPNRQIASAL